MTLLVIGSAAFMHDCTAFANAQAGLIKMIAKYVMIIFVTDVIGLSL